jgi:hypothetical protein
VLSRVAQWVQQVRDGWRRAAFMQARIDAAERRDVNAADRAAIRPPSASSSPDDQPKDSTWPG